MSIIVIPEKIDVNVRVSVAPDLLKVLQQLVDQKSDREDAAKLSEEARKTTDALKAAIPPPA